ncbi:hypothetical protein IPH92_01765 [Candidatus Kaiserbacteria bacterium]|nr:MAG: hypothetical protein IPH92_01765 [Candidatus Kaiserbacteria bacterium]
MFSHIHSPIILVVLFVVLLFPVQSASAEETFTMGTFYQTASFRWNNDNWLLYSQPRVHTFTMRDDGSAFGLTETGIPFVQYNIENTLGMRIQRFEIEDHYHYVIGGEVVYTIKDFSAELAQAYEARPV